MSDDDKQTGVKETEKQKEETQWVIRCKKCGFTRPITDIFNRKDTYTHGKCTIKFCTRCYRVCCHFIEKRRNPK